MLSVNHPHSLHSANKMWLSLKWCFWLTSFSLCFRAAAPTCLVMLHSKSWLSSAIKAVYWLLYQIERPLDGHEKCTLASHKAVNEFVNLIGGLSVLPSTILSFPTIVLIVKFSLVYFTIQTHSGLNDALDALETSQLFCWQSENQQNNWQDGA